MSQADAYRTWKHWDADSFGTLTPEMRFYYLLELETSGLPARPLHVLEIGFGNGGFAAYCRETGHSYIGTEVDPELVGWAKSQGFDALEAPDDLGAALSGQHFDLIACFDVLEHMTSAEIIETLQACATLLAEDGRIVARFPSGDSPFSMAIWNGDITHKTLIGRGAVLQYCDAAGLEAMQIRHPALPLWGLGLRRALRRATVALGRWAVRGFVRRVFYDGVPRVVDPNMLVVLRKPR